MNVKIIDLTHRHYEPVLKMPGRSGKNYIFRWDSKLGYYSFETESQEEINDLFEGAMHWRHTYLGIHLPPPEPVAAPPVKLPAPKARKRAAPKESSEN